MTIEIIVLLAICVTMLSSVGYAIYLMQKDSKALQAALKEYLDRSVEDGYNKARRDHEATRRGEQDVKKCTCKEK